MELEQHNENPSTFDFFEDVVCRFRPNVRAGILVVLLEVLVNGGDQIRNAVKHASTQAFRRQVAKEPLDHVQPRSARWCEMHVESRMLGKPGLDLWRFVG